MYTAARATFLRTCYTVLLACVVAAPAFADRRAPAVTTTLLPVVAGTPETRSTPFIAWYQDLSKVGYVEEEYLVAGAANVYEYVDGVAQRPEVRVQTPAVPYVTRILVRRPRSEARFNGTVLVEVMNATAGWDGDPVWYGTFDYITRTGTAWVGVSTKPVTVNFLRDRWGRAPFPTRNASRYATLSMPAFGQVWDMLTQVGTLLRDEHAASNPLRGFDVDRVLMVGYSQSAAYQTTYANSFHERTRRANGQPVYDGYYIATGGASAKDVTGATAATENLPRGDARNLVRVDAPVVKLQTQTEIVNFPSYPTRQDETQYPWLRTYEIAGGSHVDTWRDVQGGQALVRDLGLPPSFCATPAVPKNPIRTGYYESAALQNLSRWVARGIPAPPSRFMELTTGASGTPVLARDANGNVLGGVRPPEIQAPRGTYLESNTGPGFCGLYGGFAPFSDAQLQALYPNRGAYVRQFVRATFDDVRDRYLLPLDAAALLRDTVQVTDSVP